MGIDFSRVATSALQAALEDGQQPEAKQHHRRLTAGKAIVAGAAVAVAAKYAVDKASPLKRKAAMAAVRHTVRNTFGDVIPESLHDKLMDSGFFDHEDEDFDGPQGETQDFFAEPEEEQSDDQDFFEEPDEEEESEDQDFFDEPEDDEPEDDEGDEPEDEPEGDAEAEPEDGVDEDDVDEDDEPRDEEGAQRAADAAPANGRAEAPGVMDVLSDTPRRRRRTRRSSKVDPAE
jgi:hypothetical protein